MKDFNKDALFGFLRTLNKNSPERKTLVLCSKDKKELILQACYYGGALDCEIFEKDELGEFESLDCNAIVARNFFQLEKEAFFYVKDFVKEFENV